VSAAADRRAADIAAGRRMALKALGARTGHTLSEVTALADAVPAATDGDLAYYLTTSLRTGVPPTRVAHLIDNLMRSGAA
jgi:hypothetical protein